MAVPQDQLVTMLNGMINATQSLRQALQTAKDLINQFANLNAGVVLQNFPTRAVNPDGSLSSTQDTPPNVAHPIDTQTITTLKVAISSNDAATDINLLEALVALLEGNAVTTQPDAPAMLAKTSQ